MLAHCDTEDAGVWGLAIPNSVDNNVSPRMILAGSGKPYTQVQLSYMEGWAHEVL